MLMRYKFCPKCAGELKEETAEALYICKQCGFHFYFSPKPCNAVILEKGSEILLVKRRFDPQKGFWDLPGGFVDPHESMEESAVREIKEELGLDIPVEHFRYLISTPDRYEYLEIPYHTICSTFIAPFPEGQEYKPQDDIEDLTWFNVDDLPLDKLAFPSMKVSLEFYLEQRAK